MTTFIFGDQAFKTKKAAEEAIRTVLYKYQLNEDLCPEDAAFIVDVAAYHPEADRKLGSGVVGVVVMQVTDRPTRGFRLRRTDGSLEEFSFTKCLRPPSPRALALKALRCLVRDQVLEFKNTAFSTTTSIRCPLTGEEVSSETCHVDHVVPFIDLALEFAQARNIELAEMTTRPGVGPEVLLTDASVAAEWVAYHRERASLRIVSRRGNLSRMRSEPQ
jgi:hypothetical protein